ncbi:hypothetical protein BB561_004085 [Smittium simulii]|uniref:Uncharacterized protein n=1 Tax=Smittium simulii TaxID=133385 RepID=A0A2T9YI56_9FUNG|nr:hypothetical protein BB561_004809 [Smittium simulii]PVU92013.1 hypothetical protein BB561_004085 [Smittium simulii]
MRFTISTLSIASMSILSVAAATSAPNMATGQSTAELAKPQISGSTSGSGSGSGSGLGRGSGSGSVNGFSGGINGGHRSGSHGGHHGGHGRRGYYRYGRYWDWDGSYDNEFAISLRYRPSVYFGQRFQYLYLHRDDFRRNWNTNLLFRTRWNTDIAFRNECFGGINYSGWNSLVIGDLGDNYYGQGRFRGYGRRYRHGNRGHRGHRGNGHGHNNGFMKPEPY